MISTLDIRRFKSIRELTLSCRRINVFIGEPNTGKSNILEALGMLSFVKYSQPGYSAKDFIRFERTSNLFHDESLELPIEIRSDDGLLRLHFRNGSFEGESTTGADRAALFSGGFDDLRVGARYAELDRWPAIKFYRYRGLAQFPGQESDSLMPPRGDNLMSVLLANKSLRSAVNQPFASMGLRLGIRPQEGKLEIVKEVEDIIISYPYSLVSETLQRLTFYLAAILSNKHCAIIFEEPESHAFPYYTKYLAELIALDQGENQYFVSTHNPYFLLPLIEKAPRADLSIHVTYFENYETRTKQLTEEDVGELAEIDVFSNLERYLTAR